MNTAIADTVATGAATVAPVTAAAPKTDYVSMLIYCAIIFAILYFFMILPNQRRMKEYKSMLDKLQVGSKILCAGGIYGVVRKIEGDKIEVEIAKGVTIEIPRNAIANIE
ncbi:MAG: preprotein translocase subunit YajC [Proteobacteria bacterium]|nr:preprotein translocase subunit YajC [Pseudomonadota bacterium]